MDLFCYLPSTHVWSWRNDYSLSDHIFLQIYLHLFLQKEVVVLTALSSSLVVRLEKLVAGESIFSRFNLECKPDFVVFGVVTILIDLWRVSDLSGVEKFKFFHHDCGDISDGFATF